jgi:hypothetical protein
MPALNSHTESRTLAIRPVHLVGPFSRQALVPIVEQDRVPHYRRGVKIGLAVDAWAWLYSHAVASPGIVFEALTDGWMVTAEVVDEDYLEIRNYRLR